MAADADAPDGELSKTAAKTPSPASPDHTDDDSPVSPEDSESTTSAESEAADGDADEAEDYEAAVDDEVEDYEAAVDDKVDTGSEDAARAERPTSHVRLATMVALDVVVAWQRPLVAGIPGISIASGPRAAAVVPSGRAAVRAESDDDRLAAR
jgi:Mce-associated membrane protein